MKDFLLLVDSVSDSSLFAYCCIYYVLEKFILLAYGKIKEDEKSKLVNSLVLGYWEGFGFLIPLSWFFIKLNFETITLLGGSIVCIMSIYYGLIKPSVFRKGRLVFW